MNRTAVRLSAFAFSCLTLFSAGSALAQSIGSVGGADASANIFARDGFVTVRDRPRPDYQAIGLPVGVFTLFPRLQLDAETSDNIFADETDPQSDVIGRLRPSATLQSNWSRHSLNVFGRANTSAYADYDSEAATEWTAGGVGRLDVTRDSSITASAEAGRSVEPRTSANTPVFAREPIKYDQSKLYIAGVSTLNRVKVSGRVDFSKVDYKDGVAASNGALIEQDDRDRDILVGTGRVDYAVSPATSFFVQAAANDRSYKTIVGGVPNRSSNGYELLVGSSFELGALVRGELAVGYVEQSFDNIAYNEISGFGARGELTWAPTELTTVTFTGSRTIEDAGIVNSAGYLSTTLQAQVDHELLRNFILTGILTYGQDEFDDLSRTDDRLGASFSGTYLINRNLGVALSYSRSSRDSQATGLDYDLNRVVLSVISQF